LPTTSQVWQRQHALLAALARTDELRLFILGLEFNADAGDFPDGYPLPAGWHADICQTDGVAALDAFAGGGGADLFSDLLHM
jgi:hypothetical protein